VVINGLFEWLEEARTLARQRSTGQVVQIVVATFDSPTHRYFDYRLRPMGYSIR